MMAQLCRELGLPLVVDAAQALGQVDCAVGADVTYASSRKWIAGPRGVGVLAVRPDADCSGYSRGWRRRSGSASFSVAQRLEFGEANIAARVGFSVALGEHLAFGPECGARTSGRGGQHQPDRRSPMCRVAGGRRGRRAERDHHVGAGRRRRPGDGAGWLIAERRILTTYAGVQRAPLEMTAPVLRISPHVDTTADDLEVFAEALIAATAATAT